MGDLTGYVQQLVNTRNVVQKDMNMRTVETLIDECITKCGSSAELARRIGCHRSEITLWKTATRPVSAETVGILCDVLELPGEEASRLAVLAIIETAKPEKRGVLRRAFFALSVAGAAFGLAVPPRNIEAGPIGGMNHTQTADSQSINCRALSWLNSLVDYLVGASIRQTLTGL